VAEHISEEGTPPVEHTETPRVLVFFDYACQFCYLDWPRFKRLRAEKGAELVLMPFELRPTLPGEGVPISEIGGGHSQKVEEHMMRMAAEGGLRLTLAQFVPNTHYALALGEFARDRGSEIHEAVHDSVFSAYNADGRDIGGLDIVMEIAENHGFDRTEVEVALTEGLYDDRLHQFYHLAQSFGITATPSALICNELFIGSRPYAVLEEALSRCLVTEHNIASHLVVDDDHRRVESEPGAVGESARTDV